MKNVEGAVLFSGTAYGSAGIDTSGLFLLDTGAGPLALDADLTRILGINRPANRSETLTLTERPLRRLELGHLQFDLVAPVLSIDAGIVRRAIDEPVLGLVGARLLRGFAVVLDFRTNEIGFMPATEIASADSTPPSATAASRRALGSVLGHDARPIAFRIIGDDKLVVRAQVLASDRARSGDPLTLIVDTGATKTTFFGNAIDRALPQSRGWRSLAGLSAPTLTGSANARMVRVPIIEVGEGANAVETRELDATIIDSDLERALARDIGEPAHGLLGYSFLRRFRVIIDMPHRLLWLEPIAHSKDERPFEYSHVGIQIERRGRALIVVGVATGSPAGRAGIRKGDELVAIEGDRTEGVNVIDASRLLEGPPGTAIRLTLRRAGQPARVYRFVRRQLL